MASTRVFQVGPEFNMNVLVDQMVQSYQAQGFSVTVMPFGNGVSMEFKKDDDGIKKYLGLGLGIRANLTLNNGTLCINYDNEDWTIKLVALGAGLLLSIGCIGVVLLITGAIGTINQGGLSGKISGDFQMFAGGSPTMGGQPYAQPYQPPQQPYQSPVQPQPPQQPYQPPVQPQQAQPPQTVCTGCGAPFSAYSQYCPNCGAKKQ